MWVKVVPPLVEVAVTRIEYVPAGVFVTCGNAVPVEAELHADSENTAAEMKPSRTPAGSRRRGTRKISSPPKIAPILIKPVIVRASGR